MGNGNLCMVYGAVAVLSVLLLIGYALWNKKENRSIYQKLEVSSRDELMLYIELFRRCDRLDELIDA